MMTNKNGLYYFNLASKVTLGTACGVFGGIHLFTGSLILGLLAAGIAVVFAKDSVELYGQHNAELNPNPEVKKTDKDPSDRLYSRKTKKDIQKGHHASLNLTNVDPNPLLPPTSRLTKLRPKSEPRHPRPVFKLDLSAENLALPRKTHQTKQPEPSHKPEIKLESTPTYVPLVAKKSPTHRLSQQPSLAAIDSARVMTEKELEDILNKDTPKKKYEVPK